MTVKEHTDMSVFEQMIEENWVPCEYPHDLMIGVPCSGRAVVNISFTCYNFGNPIKGCKNIENLATDFMLQSINCPKCGKNINSCWKLTSL